MRRPVTAALCGLGLLAVIVLGVGQLVLPGLAARQVRSDLGGSAQVQSVSVSAFPAVKLLWHHADRVSIHLRSYRSGASRLGGSLGQAGDVGRLTVSVGTAYLGLLTVRDVRLSGVGGRLTGAATITEADLRNSIPFLQSVTPTASGDGQLTLRGTANVLGLRASIDADVAVRDGGIVVAPDVPLGALATITVFSDPRVTVTGLQSTPVSGGFRLAGSARVR